MMKLCTVNLDSKYSIGQNLHESTIPFTFAPILTPTL